MSYQIDVTFKIVDEETYLKQLDQLYTLVAYGSEQPEWEPGIGGVAWERETAYGAARAWSKLSRVKWLIRCDLVRVVT